MKTNSTPAAGYQIVKEGTQFCLYAPSGDEVGKFDTRREAVAKLKEVLKAEDTTETKVA